ncbi:MAG: hypothetical protein JXQ83_04680 [Candidatus Glassbacteria bacterium]|nr:hypothetical protein [Candidatus Glassbacteria bacterium]
MVTPVKKIWLDIGLSVIGGVFSYPLAHGMLFALGYFFNVPSGIGTVVFVTTYSGLVFVFIFRIWDDVRILTEDVKIIVIYNENKALPAEMSLAQTYPILFDEETYESFQRLLCSFPPEYTVFKLNRLFFLNGIASLPTPKLNELVNNQKAFSQLITRLKTDDYIRTDGYSFSIQLGKWEAKRKEMMERKSEFQKWQEIANRLIEQNRG